MISVSDLWIRLDGLSSPLPSERITLASAQGRILREPILAPEDQPPFDRSAIDGYLVHATQLPGTVTLTGTVSPGSPPPVSAPAPSTALRILTGSALPSNPDAALIMQEDTTLLSPNQLHLLEAPSTRHIRRRASQARAGDTLLIPGSPLNAGALALLASIGSTTPLVSRRARVAHLVTGGELVSADTTPASGQIRDSNSTLIASLLRDTHADLVWQQRVSDSRSATADALAAALATDADILLISGGASVGDHDHTGALLAAQGFTIHCDKVASRPGKPFIAASRDGRLAFGLPGNPLSHFVCFHLFVRRVLARLAGTEPVALVRAKLAPRSELRPDPRETWWPCIYADEGATRRVLPLPWRDSSDLTVLATTEGLLRIPSATTPGAEVEVLPCR
ncbi:MAG: molybdopterin molybdotransferase MoeA [Opitutaceae bacterium]|nr:molybdopterin molybdotransferase MoeA [Opitutaceae bacterium]